MPVTRTRAEDTRGEGTSQGVICATCDWCGATIHAMIIDEMKPVLAIPCRNFMFFCADVFVKVACEKPECRSQIAHAREYPGAHMPPHKGGGHADYTH